ncbi:hypothetical protein OQA88_7176 [Cercophora sp. LCS_1]
MSTNPLILVPEGNHPPAAPSIASAEEKHCANCHGTSDLRLCKQCRGVWYCSDECAAAMMQGHKKLCYKFRTEQPVVPGLVRVFFFPDHTVKPLVKFISATDWAEDVRRDKWILLPNQESTISCITADTNYMTGKPLTWTLKIVFRHWQADNMGLNKSIPFCFSEQGTPKPRIP